MHLDGKEMADRGISHQLCSSGRLNCLPDVVADDEGRELVQHGSALFPIACYEEDLKSYSVAWHWHEEFEYILAVKARWRWT